MPNKIITIATQEEIAKLNAPYDIGQRIENIIKFLRNNVKVSPENLKNPAYMTHMVSQLLNSKPQGDIASTIVPTNLIMKYYDPTLSLERQLSRIIRLLIKDIGMPPDVLASRPEFLQEVLELQQKIYEETCLDALMNDENIQPHAPEVDAINARQEAANYLQWLPFALPSLAPFAALPLQLADLVISALPASETPLAEAAQEESSYLSAAAIGTAAVGGLLLAGWGLWKMTRRNAESSVPDNADTARLTVK